MMIEIKKNAENTIVEIVGRLETTTAPSLEKTLNDDMGDTKNLILDLKGLEYISSAGLRVLIATQKKLKPENIPFVIKNVNDAVGEIFRMSGFDKLLKIE